MVKITLVLISLLCVTTQAQAAPALIDPVIFPVGGSTHLTPVDQNGVPIVPSSLCKIIGWPAPGNLPATLLTVSYDEKGAILTGVTTTGASGLAQWQCVNGPTIVSSKQFTITVAAPPWGVTAVYDTMP